MDVMLLIQLQDRPGIIPHKIILGVSVFFNNLAVALEYLRRVHGVKKFLVFDFDVHYGNGTA